MCRLPKEQLQGNSSSTHRACCYPLGSRMPVFSFLPSGWILWSNLIKSQPLWLHILLDLTAVCTWLEGVSQLSNSIPWEIHLEKHETVPKPKLVPELLLVGVGQVQLAILLPPRQISHCLLSAQKFFEYQRGLLQTSAWWSFASTNVGAVSETAQGEHTFESYVEGKGES